MKIAEIIVISVFASIAFFMGQFYQWIFSIMAIYAMITISWNLMKTIGRLSMGHAMLFALPAYLSAIALNFSFEASIYVFFISTIFLSILFYFFSKFTGRTAFVFLSLVISILLWISIPRIVIRKNGYLIGGEVGFNFYSVSTQQIFFISAISLVLAYVFSSFILSSKLGYFMKAVGDDETASKAVGINVDKVKFLTMLFSTSISSLSGLLYALNFGHISYDVFSVEISIFPFVASLLSAGNLFLSVISSFFLIFLTRSLNSIYPSLMDVFYALILIFSPRIGGFVYVKSKKFVEEL